MRAMPGGWFHHCRGRGVAVAVVLALVLPSAGCHRVEDWSKVQPQPQPQVELTTLRHIVGFPPASHRLTAAEHGRLDTFIGRVQPATAESIIVAPGAPAPRDTWQAQRQRAEAVAAVLRRAGAPMVTVEAAAVPALGDLPAGSVMVAVRRYLVTLPACPNWSRNPRATYNNQPSSNWGCATAINFGLMLHDPRDLVRGRDLAPADGEHQARAIQRYRDDEIRPLMGESASDMHSLPSAQ
ncbi:MAG: hypothetical protein EA406_00895 [Rhodospirillales bacterium]|nr:MAG: hypothetical protein EA406_00895 [Rhodospirillales bacterium]